MISSLHVNFEEELMIMHMVMMMVSVRRERDGEKGCSVCMQSQVSELEEVSEPLSCFSNFSQMWAPLRQMAQ
jgi:hypothetical protein